MKRSFLVSVGGLCLAAGVIAYAGPIRAQNVCYITNSAGETLSLDSLCQSDFEASAESVPQVSGDPEAVEADVNEAAGTTEPVESSYTITINGTESTEIAPSDATAESDAADGTNIRTITSGPGQPIDDGAIMIDRDPRVIINQPGSDNQSNSDAPEADASQ